QTQEGDFGEQNVFLMELASGEKKNVTINQMSLNKIIDEYGEDTKQWIGKPARAWILKQIVAGKLRPVLCLTAVDKDFDGNRLEDASTGAAGEGEEIIDAEA